MSGHEEVSSQSVGASGDGYFLLLVYWYCSCPSLYDMEISRHSLVDVSGALDSEELGSNLHSSISTLRAIIDCRCFWSADRMGVASV